VRPRKLSKSPLQVKATALTPIERVERVILLIRGQRAILDADLARLYGVPTKRLNEQVRRNAERFPPDFTFHLSAREKAEVVANCDHLRSLKFSPQRPRVFTEHGAIMAANVLNSPAAITASVFVVRAFVKLREMLATHRELAFKFAELERRLQKHDHQIIALIDAIRDLMTAPRVKPKPQIGYHTEQARRKPRPAKTPKSNEPVALVLTATESKR